MVGAVGIDPPSGGGGKGKMNYLEILKHLYNSEINVRLSCFCDCGFIVALGDDKNGYKATDNFYSLEHAIQWLDVAARKYHPHSEYAKWTWTAP